ncbi:hypothetical protein SAMN05216359_104156 [Roseateles sp. YR242]|uniref:hypothetical protein n=1 Tax=Roseateles sp. YR242 TaxID=1855305 RepID=UPI0008D538E2|nr:hypothetical protein [Roseateles sp. YR242]SEK96615.1 hypothetical protein SAMN05216359_104156 [Roseateles sp. YR242]
MATPIQSSGPALLKADPSLSDDRYSALVRQFDNNRRCAIEVLGFLQSTDPAAMLPEEARRRMLDDCQLISSRKSLEDVQHQISLGGQIPPRQRTLCGAIGHDEYKLDMICRQLRMYATALLDGEIRSLQEARQALEKACGGPHATISNVADGLTCSTMPQLHDVKQGVLRINATMTFIAKLQQTAQELTSAYRAIDHRDLRIWAILTVGKMADHSFDSLIDTLKAARRFADGGNPESCNRKLRQFDEIFEQSKSTLQLILREGSATQPDESSA